MIVSVKPLGNRGVRLYRRLLFSVNRPSGCSWRPADGHVLSVTLYRYSGTIPL